MNIDLFGDRVSLCGSGWIRACDVAKASPKITVLWVSLSGARMVDTC